MQKEIYLDYAATTPLDTKVKASMLPYLGSAFGNPSALYKKGREAKQAVESSRKSIAGLIGSRPEEIIFTAGGTESNNLAIFGILRAALGQSKKKFPHIITTSIEHASVLEPIKSLQGEGFLASLVKVDSEGIVSPENIKKQIRPETVLVSVMYANNEIGSIQPIAEIGKLIRQENQKRAAKKLPIIYFHTDACQAAGLLDINVQKLGVDLMTINGSKIYGPKQSGFLFVRNGLNIKPLMYGGGQEKALRSGTENVANIVGFSTALKLAQENKLKESKRLVALRDYFFEKLNKNISEISLNGPGLKSAKRLANNLNISVMGVEGEALLLYLDAQGVYVSTGSSCDSSSGQESHVLRAIGLNAKMSESAIRITLGKITNKKDIDYALQVLVRAVSLLRKSKTT
jgi:cysteine desulfurase